MTAENWYKEGNFTSINELDIFFRRKGEGNTLVCIHGFPTSSWDFEPMWEPLVKQFQVIAHDLIGLGKSAKPQQNLSIRLQADIVETLLIQKGINEAHILAHDLGDTVAQELLARQKDNTSKIKWLSCILMNGGIFPETHQPLLVQKILLSPLGKYFVYLMTEKTMRKNLNRIFSEEHPPSNEFIEDSWKLVCSNNGKSMIPKLIYYMVERKTNRERWVQPLIESMVPIRLINGVQDPISGEHAARRFEEVIPNADVIRIMDAGHYPHVETPNKVLKSIFDFHKEHFG